MPNPVNEDEDKLSYVITMAEKGFGLTPLDIRGLIQGENIPLTKGMQERIGSKHLCTYEIANNSGRKHSLTTVMQERIDTIIFP